MPLALKDRVRETSSTTGTGTITLAGAVAGFQSFSVIGNANTTYYAIVDSSANTWEVGLGTYTASGTTLSRDTVLESSAGGVRVSFGAGAKDVFCTYPAEQAVTLDDVQTFTNKTLTGYTETVFALTGTTPALNPGNGTVQTWTLSGNSTPTDSIAAGQSMTLMINDGTAFTITWPSVTWKTDAGVAPTLNTTGFTAIVLWDVGGVLYGARVGDA